MTTYAKETIADRGSAEDGRIVHLDEHGNRWRALQSNLSLNVQRDVGRDMAAMARQVRSLANDIAEIRVKQRTAQAWLDDEAAYLLGGYGIRAGTRWGCVVGGEPVVVTVVRVLADWDPRSRGSALIAVVTVEGGATEREVYHPQERFWALPVASGADEPGADDA